MNINEIQIGDILLINHIRKSIVIGIQKDIIYLANGTILTNVPYNSSETNKNTKFYWKRTPKEPNIKSVKIEIIK